MVQNRFNFGLFIGALLIYSGCATVDPYQTFKTDQTFRVEVWNRERAWNGTTMLSQSFDPGDSMNSRIVEINMRGEIIWGYDVGAPGSISSVQVLPNNNILFSISSGEGRGRPGAKGRASSSAGGAFEVNRKGEIVWKYIDNRISHNAVRLASGNTLLTAAHSEDLSTWPYRDPQVFEIDPSGHMVWAFHFKDIYGNDPKYKDIRGTGFAPWTHTNDAIRLPNGNTLVSARNLNLVIEVNKEGKLIRTFGEDCLNCAPLGLQVKSGTAGKGGRIVGPHSPVLLPNGNLLVNEPGMGRTLEYDPSSKRIVWEYGQKIRGRLPEQEGDFLHPRASQRLPNGNTLIVDSSGQLIEVTREKEVVWN